MHRCRPGTEIVLAREKVRALQKMKNSGNEAKKWLKTKENDFLEVRKLRAFCVPIDASCTPKGGKTRHLTHNEAKTSLPPNEARRATSCRLHKGHFSPAKAGAGADVVFERLRCAEGAVRGDCAAFLA